MLGKIWNASPASLARSISYRIRHALGMTQSLPRWRKIKSGPASGLQMLLSDAWADMETGRWDHSIHEALESIGGLEGATMWDVGAHVGYHTLGFARLVGAKGRVIAFEPNPFNHERFTLNVRRNQEISSRVTIEGFALSDQTSEMNLEVSADVDGSMSSCTHLEQAVTPLTSEVYRQFKSVRVPVTTVDAIISARPEAAPRLIKIDVEGAEHFVLMGAKQCLATVRPALIIEVHNITCMFEVMRILLAAQYRPRIIDHEENNTWRCFLMALPPNS
jgi:FkbM family methyltransferase